MTAEDLKHFIQIQFDGMNKRIDELREDFAEHRKETQAAIAASNSRMDNWNTMVISSMGAAILALIGAIVSLFQPKH